MRLDDGSRDREPDAGAAVLARARGVGPVEAFEEAGQVLGGDPDAGVGHLHLDRAVVSMRRHRDCPPAGVNAHGVVHQVEEHLVHALGDRHRPVGGRSGIALSTTHARPSRATSISDKDLGHERRQRHVSSRSSGSSPDSSRDRSSSCSIEPAQPLGLRQHHLQRGGVGLFDAVQQVLQVRPDRGDRRLELMGDVRDQVAAALLQVLELRAHPVERVRELPDLVAAIGVDAWE